MNAYTWLMAAVLFLALLMGGEQPRNKHYIWVSCFLMFVVMGLRDVYSIGIDSTSSYVNGFYATGPIPWDEMPRLGESNNQAFSYFVRFLYDVTDGNYQLYYSLYSAIILWIFARFIERYSPNPIQSFVYFWGLLCYIFLFDAMKQALAMAFVTLAFDAIIDKKPFRFTALVIVAYLFHAPALIFIAAYPVSLMKPGRGYLIFLAAMLAFTYQFRDQILELMLSFYDTTLYDYDMNFLGNKVLIMIVIVVAAMVLRPPTENDRVYGILLQFMGIAIVIQTFASYNNTFERLANYYFQFAVVFIPMVFQLDRPRSPFLDNRTEAIGKKLAPWAFGAFGVWRFANYISSNAWLWLPFRFFFET